MDALYHLMLQELEQALITLVRHVPPPKWVAIGSGFAYRYIEKSIHQAIVQKLARVVSGLHAARILLLSGFVQEQGAIQRMLDEFQEDVLFLSYAAIYGDVTDIHREYLEAFYQEEFDDPDNALGSTQKRPMVSRKKIRAYISRIEGSGVDASRSIEVNRTINKAYSGYVHGASPHIMEMYGGSPPRFHVAGLLKSPLYLDHKDDLWNYFYRGICSFGFAAKALGDESLFSHILQLRNDFEVKSGKSS